MTRRLLFCGLMWSCLGLATSARAGGEWFVLADWNAWSAGSVNHPLAKQLRDLARRQVELRCVAFTPEGDWLVLAAGAGVRTSKTSLPVVKRLLELQRSRAVQCVAFTPRGGWVILWGQNGYQASGIVPQGAVKKLDELAAGGHTLRSIAFAPNGGWVLLFDEIGVWYSDVPDELGQVLKQTLDRGLPVHCVAFTNLGTWFALTGGGWFSNDAAHPVAKQLAKLSRGNRPLKWLAVAPEDLATVRYALEVKPAQRVRALLTTPLSPVDSGAGEWYLFAPEAPALPGQSDVRTTFRPDAEVVREGSPLRRPFFLCRIEGVPKEHEAVLTVEATLNSRRLRPLATGEEAPKVPDLPPEEVAWYTRSSRTLDTDSPALREWVERSDLKRKPGESDMAYARRVFAYIKHHLTYEFPTVHHASSSVCAAGKSDCGGLAGLFASTLRGAGVPARLIAGRWAESQVADDRKIHARAEFFAQGVGWVPVDLSQAVSDLQGDDFRFFGNDPGDFLVLSLDVDFALDPLGLGARSVSVVQGISRWGHGGGGGRGGRFDDEWTVVKSPLP